MWPDRISNPGPLALEPDALPTALRGPAHKQCTLHFFTLRLNDLGHTLDSTVNMDKTA